MLPPAEPGLSAQLAHSYGTGHHPPESLLLETLRVLHRRAWVIAGSAAAGLVLALLYLLLRTPGYEATAQIEITPANTSRLALEEPEATTLSRNDSTMRLQAAVKVLQSNSLALEVMDYLGLAQNGAFAGHWRQPSGTDSTEWPPDARDRLQQRFQKSLRVELVPKTDIIAITFRSRDPQLAAAAVNVIVQQYRERSLRTSYESASQISDWLSKQLDELKNKARSSQEQLATLERTTGLLGQDDTDNIVFEKLKQLDEQLTEMESERIVKEARYRIASSGDPELLATSAPDTTLQFLRTQQATLHAQYAQLSSKYGTGYPKLAELADQMSSADAAVDHELAQLKQRYRNDYDAALHSEQMLRTSFEAQKQKAYRLNEDAAQHAILKHEVESTQQLYETLQLKLKQAGISAGLASADIQIIDPPQVPSEPSEPKPAAASLIGLGLGLLCGAAVALGLESADDSIRTPEEAEEATGLPVLGAIPLVQDAPRWPAGWLPTSLRRRHDSLERALMFCEPAPMAAECYRSACHSLLLASATVPRVIAFVSAMPLEGKTTSAVNCAIALAQHGTQVLLVDADLRHPSVHNFFGLELSRGFRNAPGTDGAEPRAIAQQPGLSVLTAGDWSEDGSRVAGTKAMAMLIAQWGASYDYVVIDTPPATLVGDALVLATYADAAVLVLRSGLTSRSVVRRMRDALQRSHSNVSGILLNAADMTRHYGYRLGARKRAEAYYDQNHTL